MKLIIAEKPSVGRDIAKVLGALSNNNGYCEGSGYICTWAFGHLVSLYDCSDYKEEWKSWKSIPVIPTKFEIKLNSSSGVKEQMEVIKKLINRDDVTTIVCATDAGREGELIFRHIYNYLRCKKPIERLWINSMVEEDIKKGFENLEDGDSIVAEYDVKFENRDEAESIVQAVDGTCSIIQSVKREIKRKKAPMLFDITLLQKECNKRLGLNAKNTLDVAQSLYEKKLITYPRTDSKFLNASMEIEARNLAEQICSQRDINVTINTKAVIDDTKVSDHHAIIPTIKALHVNSLNETERDVLEMIMLRFIVSMSPAMLYEHVSTSIKAGDYIFKANANRTIESGWTALDFEDRTNSIDAEKQDKNIRLFEYKENDSWQQIKSNVNSIETKPKQRFTDDTLLTAMENASLKDFKNIDGIERVGLGTGATRAAIIEVLLDRGYIERRKKSIIPTERGMKLIDIVPKEISDVSMTVRWEEQIAEIKKGKIKSNVFVKQIEDYVCEVIKNYYKPKDTISRKEVKKSGNVCPECGGALVIRQGRFGTFEGCGNYPECKYIKKKEKTQTNTAKAIGTCPKCGGILIKRKSSFGSFIGCTNYPKCKYIKK